MSQVGESRIDNNSQFENINSEVKTALKQGIPVISIDTKKKRKTENFDNKGHEYRVKHNAHQVLDHDFPITELSKVAPYRVYTLNNNKGFVNLGTSQDTPNFAVDSIFAWWETVGFSTFPESDRLLITCDCGGGSNDYRSRVWLTGLQELADKTRLKIEVCHFPPGTSKWIKIEHRMFCYILKSWQGKPLIDIMAVIKLIGSATTQTGLEIVCRASYENYPLAEKVSNKDLHSINITRNDFHGEWNYIISPRQLLQIILR
jgi:hypothetical protein